MLKLILTVEAPNRDLLAERLRQIATAISNELPDIDGDFDEGDDWTVEITDEEELGVELNILDEYDN